MDKAVFQPVRAWPAQLKPRERLLSQGPAALSDAELLAILLRTGRRGVTVVELAQRLLVGAGGLKRAAELGPAAWLQETGIGPSKAATVLAALELGRRTWSGLEARAALTTPAAVAEYTTPRFLGERRESLWVLGLDAKNRVVADALVGAGTADRAPGHAREVFAPLIRSGALKGVLVHNHPSGDPEPSAADVRLTKRLIEAAQLLDLPLVDHVIVGDGAWVSLRERGLVRFE